MYSNLKQKEQPKNLTVERTERRIIPFNYTPQLTAREREVLVNIIEGLTSKDIAERLFVCTDTIDTHRRNINKRNVKGHHDFPFY